MDRKLSLKKGDICIMAIIPMSDASRRIDMSLDNINEWIEYVEVISVGRKYITVKRCSKFEHKFDVENDYREKSKYSPNYKLYENIQEVYDEREAEKINDYIRDKIGQYGSPRFNLNQLKRIKDIIDEE